MCSLFMRPRSILLFFFFNDTATTEIYTLSLHDALPNCRGQVWLSDRPGVEGPGKWLPLPVYPRSRPIRRDVCFSRRSFLASTGEASRPPGYPLYRQDRKSTRLNSSHGYISYAVFCL